MSISPVKVWRNQKKTNHILGKAGRILSYTLIYVPPLGFENEAPYPVVLVELEDAAKYTAQLVDYDEKNLQIGQKVIAVLRKTRNPGLEGIIPYGIKFKPI